MVAAAPFRGLRFDPAVVGDHAQVTAPPYDVISPEARDAYEAQRPYNVVRLILARSEHDAAPQTERDGSADYGHVAGLLASGGCWPASPWTTPAAGSCPTSGPWPRPWPTGCACWRRPGPTSPRCSGSTPGPAGRRPCSTT